MAPTPSGLGCPQSHHHGMVPLALAEAQHVRGQGFTEGTVCSHLPTGLSLFPEGKTKHPHLCILSQHSVKFLAQRSRCLRNVCSIN